MYDGSTGTPSRLTSAPLLEALPHLSEDQQAFLQEPPFLEELDEAVKRTKADLPSGPDGLSRGFYKIFWPELRGFFPKVVNNLVPGARLKTFF